MKKKGQLKISFGMIFSIILVIAFLGFGFYVIKNFISLQDQLTMQKFEEDFQGDLTSSWKDEVSMREVSYRVLPEVERVCVVNPRRPTHNFEIYMDGLPHELNFEHLDVENSTKGKASICTTPEDSRVKFVLEKKYGAPLVIVKM